MKNPVQMMDLRGQHLKIEQEINESISNVISQGQFINGPEVAAFQKNLESYLGVNHVIPCANGTDALQLALMVLDLPVGSEVLVPSFNYIAAAEVIVLLGYRPILFDVDVDSFLLDIEQAQKLITPKTKVIIAVHLFGQCCAMEKLMQLAEVNDLVIIEDTAQALGAEYIFEDKSRKKAGTIGHIGTTSFFPTKNLGCMGDGGAIFTNNEILAGKLKKIANHGQYKKYYFDEIGMNSRLDTMQAGILDVKLRYLDEYIALRQKAAKYYEKELSHVKGITLPTTSAQSTHAFHQYTIKVHNGKRDKLKADLANQGIPSVVYYPEPIHLQKAYKAHNNNHCSRSGELSKSVLSLPMHTELTNEQLDSVCESIIHSVE